MNLRQTRRSRIGTLLSLITFSSIVMGVTLLPAAAPENLQATPESTVEPESTPEVHVPLEFELFIPEIVSVRPHDATSWTQGLLVHPDGTLYESAGLDGESDLRQVDGKTGEILRIHELPVEFFAEGLALVDDRLIQITWKNQVAFVWDVETFELLDEFSYEGEGWGLCYDGEVLYMSDGSANLFKRDPETFELLETIPVLYEGQPISALNELECVDESVYANIWYEDWIVRIDKITGAVTGLIDGSVLLTPEERTELGSSAVLNGIAYDPETGHFLLTGKWWRKLFEVRLIPFEIGE